MPFLDPTKVQFDEVPFGLTDPSQVKFDDEPQEAIAKSSFLPQSFQQAKSELAALPTETIKTAFGIGEAVAGLASQVPAFFGLNLPAGIMGGLKGAATVEARKGVAPEKLIVAPDPEKDKAIVQVMSDEMNRVKEKLSPFMVYEPRTKAGKRAMEYVNKAYDFLIGAPTDSMADLAEPYRPYIGDTATDALKAGIKVPTELLANVVLFKSVGKVAGKFYTKVGADGKLHLTPKEQARFERELTLEVKRMRERAPIEEGVKKIQAKYKLPEQKALPEGELRKPQAADVIPKEGVEGEGFQMREPGPKTVIRKPLTAPLEVVERKIGGDTYKLYPREGGTIPFDPARALPAGTEGKTTVGQPLPVTPEGQVIHPSQRPPELQSKEARMGQKSTGEAIAKSLDIIYNGEQSRVRGQAPLHLFTDKKTGTTFSAESLSQGEVAQKLEFKRQQFAQAAPKNVIQELSDAVGKSDEPQVLVKGGITKAADQIDAIVRDAVGQKVTTAQALRKRGKPQDIKMAEKLEAEAIENGDKLKSVGDPATNKLVDKAEEGVPKKQGAELIEEPTPVATNASGESAASLEAISRNKTTKFYMGNDLTGKVRPVIGVDAVDAKPGPFETMYSVKGDVVTKLDRGVKVTGTKDATIERELNKLSRPPKTIAPKELLSKSAEEIEASLKDAAKQKKSVFDIMRDEKGAVDLEGVNALFEKLGEKIKGKREAWKEFWEPFSTMLEGEKFKFDRSKVQGDLGRVERIVERYAKTLKKYPMDVRADVYRALDGRLPIEQLPQEVQGITRSIQQRTITIGKMLTERGMISQETFDIHKGQYVHHMIGKYLLGKTGMPITSKMGLGTTKGRKGLSVEESLELGLIEDAGIAVPYGTAKTLTDIVKFDHFKRIAQNPNWTWQRRVNIEGKDWRIGDLTKEVKRYEQMLLEQRVGPEVRDRYMVLKNALDTAASRSEKVPENFRQMPDSPVYGDLAGEFVHKSIYDDMLPLYSSVMAENKSNFVKSLVKIEAESVALFKISKVALNVPTAVRNIVSNIIQNNLRGRALAKVPGDIISGARSMVAQDKLYKEAKRYGLFRTNWSMAELNEVIAEFSKIEATKWDTFMGGVRGVAKYYGKIDDINKMAIFKQLRQEGVPLQEALLEAQKWGMDYSLASRSVKELRRHAVPFISYQYKVAPLLMEAIRKRPAILFKYLAVPYVMAKAVPELHGLASEEWDKLKQQLPERIKKEKSYMVMPWKDPEGRWQWVNLEYYFPWGNWFSIARDIKQQDFSEAFKDMGVGNPIVDLVYELGKTTQQGEPPKDSFTGKPIYNKLDTPEMQWAKLAEYIYNKWAPGMLTRHGAVGKTVRAIRGTEDVWGRPTTPAQAISSWFGLNIQAVDKKQVRAERESKIRDLQAELSRVKKDKNMSQEEKRAYIKRFREERKRIMRGE